MDELKKSLGEGLDHYVKKMPEEEYFVNLIKELEAKIEVADKNEILKKILVHIIDSRYEIYFIF